MRELPSWVDGYAEYTSHLPSPELFARWTAIAVVAGALERKVSTQIYDGLPTFPNLYTVLVAPPGVGKTVHSATAGRMWESLQTHRVAASSLTAAALGDELRDAQRNVIHLNGSPASETFHSLLISSDELGVLLPGYENDFITKLVTLYDCNPYSERRRTKSENTFRIEKPQLNILACTQPAYLQNLMPEGAWDQGFASRVIFIYSGEVVLTPLFQELGESNALLKKKLERTLLHISKLHGKYKWEDDAAKAISDWNLAGGPPRPDHPKLHNYSTRRTLHLAKLCMIAAADESDELIITLTHYQRALSWLLEAERSMPDIFRAMRTGGDSKAMEELWYFAYKTYVGDKSPIPEWKLTRFLAERVPAHNVNRVLETMNSAGLLEMRHVSGVGKCYIPKGKPM